jgi:hypothetical protein
MSPMTRKTNPTKTSKTTPQPTHKIPKSPPHPRPTHTQRPNPNRADPQASRLNPRRQVPSSRRQCRARVDEFRARDDKSQARGGSPKPRRQSRVEAEQCHAHRPRATDLMASPLHPSDSSARPSQLSAALAPDLDDVAGCRAGAKWPRPVKRCEVKSCSRRRESRGEKPVSGHSVAPEFDRGEFVLPGSTNSPRSRKRRGFAGRAVCGVGRGVQGGARCAGWGVVCRVGRGGGVGAYVGWGRGVRRNAT